MLEVEREYLEDGKVRTIEFHKNIYTYMKKSELTQLTQIIEHIVAKEVRKQLPTIIAETFQKMMGKSVVMEEKQPIQHINEEIEPVVEDPLDFKASLRELFSGTPVMKPSNQVEQKQFRQYTKNPVLNQILNETTSDLRQREGLVGAAAFQGGYNPNMVATGIGPMMAPEEAPSFAPNMPVMTSLPASIPIGRPPVLTEGSISNHAPLEALPQGISVLDIAQQVPTKGVAQALTRNYSQMLKLIDKKKGKI